MRISLKHLLGLTALLSLLSGSASAVVVNMTVVGTSGSATISPDGLSISDLTVGDTFTVEIEVDNTAGPDSVQSLFTTISFDAALVDITGGGSLSPILDEG